jgi:hypothetical protein
MSQENRKRQKPFEEDYDNNLSKNINALTKELDKVKEENGTLGEKLREAEENAQMAKIEVMNMAIKYIFIRFF